jgi:hypothetical protein
MRVIMYARSRTHLEGWRSITRQKYAKLLPKGHIYTELENYCGSNTGSDLYHYNEWVDN